MSTIIFDRAQKKLRAHLRFLERSCIAFDQGDEEEALRIATSLRTIFHDTHTSVSLTRHLNFQHKELLSSARGREDPMDYLRCELNMTSAQPVRMLPMLENKFHKISIEDWWDGEIVFVHDSKNYPRKKIILTAANQDGGVHLDEKVEDFYEALTEGLRFLGIEGTNFVFDGKPPFEQGVMHYAKNTHFALIRQFGYEVISSIKHFNWIV